MDTTYVALFLENPVDLDRVHSILRGAMSKRQLASMGIEALPSRAMNGVVLRLFDHADSGVFMLDDMDAQGTGLHRGGLNFILMHLAVKLNRAVFALIGGDTVLPEARGIGPDGRLMWRDLDDETAREHLDEILALATEPGVDDDALARLDERAAKVIRGSSFGRLAAELGWDRFLIDDDAMPLDCSMATGALLRDARPRWERNEIAGSPVVLVPRDVLREAELVRELVDSDVLTVATREGLAGDHGSEVRPWHPGWLSTLVETADLALDRDEHVSLLEMSEFHAVEPGALIAAWWSDFLDELATTTPALAAWLALPDADRWQMRRARDRPQPERRGPERDNVARANEELAVLRAEAAQFGLDPDHLDDDDLR